MTRIPITPKTICTALFLMNTSTDEKYFVRKIMAG
jgi:hypothetical protein